MSQGLLCTFDEIYENLNEVIQEVLLPSTTVLSVDERFTNIKKEYKISLDIIKMGQTISNIPLDIFQFNPQNDYTLVFRGPVSRLPLKDGEKLQVTMKLYRTGKPYCVGIYIFEVYLDQYSTIGDDIFFIRCLKNPVKKLKSDLEKLESDLKEVTVENYEEYWKVREEYIGRLNQLQNKFRELSETKSLEELKKRIESILEELRLNAYERMYQ
jgi:hypothetical protein